MLLLIAAGSILYFALAVALKSHLIMTKETVFYYVFILSCREGGVTPVGGRVYFCL